MIDELPSATSSRPDPKAAAPVRARRKRGRPLEMQPHEVLGLIRELAGRDKLYRVHLEVPALYARARRLFGTWAAALAATGLDHRATLAAARRRSIETRRRSRSRPHR